MSMESDASVQVPTPGSPDQLPSLAGLCAFAREPFFLLDRGCRLLYANPAAERLFRRGQEGLLGKHLCEVYPAARGSEFEQACLQALAGRHLDEAFARPGGAGALAISSLPFPLLPSRWAHLCPLPAGVAVLISSALSADDVAQRLQLFLDHVPAILYMDEVGPDGTVVNLFVGGAIEQILGFTAAEWTGDAQLWLRQLHPQDRERVIAAQEEWRRTGQPASIEFRYIAKDGGSVWVREEVTVISDEPSRSRLVCGVVRDITAQRQAAEREHALRSQLEGILGAVRDLVVYQDDEQRVLWANEAAAASLGLQAGELLGRHCYALWHGRQEPCPNCPVAEARRTLMPAEGRVQTPDGRIWDIRGYPVLTDGKLQGIVEVTRDVTEQVKQGETLAESEARYRLVVERGGQSIIVVSGEKVIFATPTTGPWSGQTTSSGCAGSRHPKSTSAASLTPRARCAGWSCAPQPASGRGKWQRLVSSPTSASAGPSRSSSARRRRWRVLGASPVASPMTSITSSPLSWPVPPSLSMPSALTTQQRRKSRTSSPAPTGRLISPGGCWRFPAAASWPPG